MTYSSLLTGLVLSVIGLVSFSGCGSGTDIEEDVVADTDAFATTAGGRTGSKDRSVGTGPDGVVRCAKGYRCFNDKDSDVVWVMKEDGNVNGPTCQQVCEGALANSDAFHGCDGGQPLRQRDIASFKKVSDGLGFTCKPGKCWKGEAPGEGMVLISIDADKNGSKSCYFPSEKTYSCNAHPGNANCFGERYSTVCPCVAKPLDQACNWTCPPHNTKTAKWKTDGTSCLARINYWRKRACDEGWPECPPGGLPPMAECTACHECANSEAEYDKDRGAHASFKRCGETAQGEGGGRTCADVIDAFIAERKPDATGVMRCQGHCGPILRPGCRSFSWGKDRDSNFHTINWGGCDANKCQNFCKNRPGACFTHATSPSKTCQ